MPLDFVSVLRVVRKEGLSIFCASCSKYWGARDRGLPGHRCLSTSDPPCGSPLAGSDFPDYDGPITQTDRWCFMCGEPATVGVSSPEIKRIFGLCEAHVTRAAKTVPSTAITPPVVLVHRQGVRPIETVIEQPKPSKLVREMIATQEEWDYEAAKTERHN